LSFEPKLPKIAEIYYFLGATNKGKGALEIVLKEAFGIYKSSNY
jgi:hypothetical protein